MESVNDGSMVFMSNAVQRLCEAIRKAPNSEVKVRKGNAMPDNSDQIGVT
jgi:hypothetical protein